MLKTSVRCVQLANNVKLFCGDSREILSTLPKGSVDAMVTDSPYGIEDLVGGYGRGGTSVDKTIKNDKNLDVVAQVFTAARKVLAKNAWVAAFYSCRISPTFFKMMEAAGYKDHEYFNEIIWDKKTPGLGTQIRLQHENVAFYRIGKPEQLVDCMSVIQFIPLKGDAKNGNTHPHEKPDKVMDNIVSIVPGTTILDPFCGTGSTGAAAVRAKRGFVGIELDPKYFDVACAKVAKALATPTAFWE